MADEKGREDTSGAGASDIREALESLLKEHDGDRNSALRVLIQENQGLHGLLSDAEARLPADGSVVLTGDEAKAWRSYREIGEPADLRKALAERDQYRGEAGTLRKGQVVRDAATLGGYKPSVLARLAEQVDLAIVERKDKAGKPEMVPVVREPGPKEGETVETPLSEYAESRWADFLPSLRAEPEKATPGTPPRARPIPDDATARPAGPRRSLVS
jgi:hypothetical protein